MLPQYFPAEKIQHNRKSIPSHRRDRVAYRLKSEACSSPLFLTKYFPSPISLSLSSWTPSYFIPLWFSTTLSPLIPFTPTNTNPSSSVFSLLRRNNPLALPPSFLLREVLAPPTRGSHHLKKILGMMAPLPRDSSTDRNAYAPTTSRSFSFLPASRFTYTGRVSSRTRVQRNTSLETWTGRDFAQSFQRIRRRDADALPRLRHLSERVGIFPLSRVINERYVRQLATPHPCLCVVCWRSEVPTPETLHFCEPVLLPLPVDRLATRSEPDSQSVLFSVVPTLKGIYGKKDLGSTELTFPSYSYIAKGSRAQVETTSYATLRFNPQTLIFLTWHVKGRRVLMIIQCLLSANIFCWKEVHLTAFWNLSLNHMIFINDASSLSITTAEVIHKLGVFSYC